MAERRYRTRRQWQNTRLVLYVLPFLLLVGVLIGVSSGGFLVLAISAVLYLPVIAAALYRDASFRASYVVGAHALTLLRGKDELRIPAAEIIDTSLIERVAARDYYMSKVAPRSKTKPERSEAGNDFMRFCTVDIGLRTFTFGLGRGLIDRMPDSRHDLVLLRSRTMGAWLLSPEYNHELVEAIMRLQKRSDDQPAGSAA
ncbi:MAG: hypothetical protein IPM46_00550 [Flavobacteriales bacterium]|nr:hypothetical protein [Flavobacteriales bacterium]